MFSDDVIKAAGHGLGRAARRRRVRLALLAAGCVCLALGGMKSGRAEIAVSGLGAGDPLFQYIENKVLKKYAQNAKDGVPRPYAGLKADTVKALNAKGYYDPTVTQERGEPTRLSITPGEVYTISAIHIDGYDGAEVTGIGAGDVLDAAKVLAAQKAVREEINAETCYYDLDVRNAVRLDHEARTADVAFVVEHGAPATFGPVRFRGAPGIDQLYLQRFIGFEEGGCWNRGKIERTQAALIATGLLSSASPLLPEAPPDGGGVPAVFDLQERSPRSGGLGLSYYTDEGVGLSASWEHRNLFGSAEKLSTELKLSLLIQSLSVDFTKPYFLREDQKLLLNADLTREDSDAYEELSLNVGAALQRQITDELSASLGAALEGTRLVEEDGTNYYGLVSTPASATFDNRDDPLDPHEGVNITLKGEPFFDLLGEADPFVKTSLRASTYFDLAAEPDLVLALRGRLGGIGGAGNRDIPSSKRFFAGGGGSVRGYGYQEVGPLDDDGDPLGGRSVLETSVELRMKVTEKIGAVAFVDGGNVYESEYPDFEGGYYYGAGVGARYYTDFGPLRFDIAVPLNKRENVDSAFQFYISIGQAF